MTQEALAEKKIGDIAEKIKLAGNKKFIMIAGPSSSGKTTFSPPDVRGVRTTEIVGFFAERR